MRWCRSDFVSTAESVGVGAEFRQTFDDSFAPAHGDQAIMSNRRAGLHHEP